MDVKKSVKVHLEAQAEKVHSVVFKGEHKGAALTIYVPREVLKQISEDTPAELDVTFESGE